MRRLTADDETCPDCKGIGSVRRSLDGIEHLNWFWCAKCLGTGRVLKPEAASRKRLRRMMMAAYAAVMGLMVWAMFHWSGPSLFFENIKRDDGNDNASETYQNKIHSGQVCRSKYETEVAIRIGAGPACLIFSLFLISVAIRSSGSREYRVREYVCGCSGLILLACSLAAFCLPTYYNCDDQDDNVTQKLLTTPYFCQVLEQEQHATGD